ncbi:MAG TPA: hypothetical protein VEA80_10545 [Vitreimonas sp.]|uniref:hypothetical protein n=1 Tax=Vitreimonas sp. TaxID=3069702 RepID=UPI002D443015|nr:hypothetical protein [Vitreimonas sp.]HYD87905.1 hypothetical protein [Vitreimonas sp.]
MSEELALAYANSVNRQVCDEFSSDLRKLTEVTGGLPHEIEREFATFFADLQTAAAETRELIAEIEALTR